MTDSDDEDLVNLDIDDGVNVVYSSEEEECQQILHGVTTMTVVVMIVPFIPYTHRLRGLLRETLMPLDDHATHWANYLGELVRELPLHYPSWRQMPPERKAGVVAKIGIYNSKKVALKERYWVPNEDGTYDVKRIRRGRPSHIFEMESSATREYPSLIHTFFLIHTVGGVFLNPKDKALYAPTPPRVYPTPTMRSWSLFAGASRDGTFSVLVGFCRDMARSFRPRLHARTPLMSDDKFFQMLTQLESQPDGSGGCGDDEQGDDEDDSEDEEDKDDS
nr:hypothetical protein [Tanacetum cinerariifolium]